jgi:hypothetical protein
MAKGVALAFTVTKPDSPILFNLLAPTKDNTPIYSAQKYRRRQKQILLSLLKGNYRY